MRGKTSKLWWEWEEKQVNYDEIERRNKQIRMIMSGETSKLGCEWEEKQNN